jgi:CTP synthase (UTP-ammonia lyase)
MPASVILLGDRDTRFITHRAIDATIALLPDDVTARWVGTDEAVVEDLTIADGLWVLPGTPYRNEAVVMEALRRRRTEGWATLGTCGGFQHMVVEFARNVVAMQAAGHAETDDGGDQVVDRLSCSLVGETRIVTPVAGSRLAEIVGNEPFPGFHYCNYGVSPAYQERLSHGGLRWSAFAPDAGVECVELGDHPFYLGTLFQPQMTSLDGQLHPLVAAFAAATRRAPSL